MLYSGSFLQSMFWYGLLPDQCVEVLSRLPLLDLRSASNAAIFWHLRDYVTLSHSDDIMSASTLLEIVVLWLIGKFICTFALIWCGLSPQADGGPSSNTSPPLCGRLPAIMVVTLFDLIVFGCMTMIVLSTALKVKGILQGHKSMLAEAKYEVTLTIATLQQGDMPLEEYESQIEDRKTSRRILFEELEMAQQYTSREQIFFGMEITPGKVISVGATAVMAVFTLIQEMVNSAEFRFQAGVSLIAVQALLMKDAKEIVPAATFLLAKNATQFVSHYMQF